mmetsp:Transcript_49977/g.106313  ORF Transcript_49977/g.106313 Transcript_49977/m.106313 type:complete len:98 (+) Transcript_49977:1091-1384(+)
MCTPPESLVTKSIFSCTSNFVPKGTSQVLFAVAVVNERPPLRGAEVSAVEGEELELELAALDSKSSGEPQTMYHPAKVLVAGHMGAGGNFVVEVIFR